MPQFPEDNFKKIETYKKYKLNGRFIPRHQEGRKASFRVEVISPEGFEFEQVVISPLSETERYPDDEVEQLMKERATALAKERIDNRDFEKEERYHEPLSPEP